MTLKVIDSFGERKIHKITPFEEMLETQYIHTCRMRDILDTEGRFMHPDVYEITQNFYIATALLFGRYVRERFAADFEETI